MSCCHRGNRFDLNVMPPQRSRLDVRTIIGIIGRYVVVDTWFFLFFFISEYYEKLRFREYIYVRPKTEYKRKPQLQVQYYYYAIRRFWTRFVHVGFGSRVIGVLNLCPARDTTLWRFRQSFRRYTSHSLVNDIRHCVELDKTIRKYSIQCTTNESRQLFTRMCNNIIINIQDSPSR